MLILQDHHKQVSSKQSRLQWSRLVADSWLCDWQIGSSVWVHEQHMPEGESRDHWLVVKEKKGNSQSEYLPNFASLINTQSEKDMLPRGGQVQKCIQSILATGTALALLKWLVAWIHCK